MKQLLFSLMAAATLVLGGCGEEYGDTKKAFFSTIAIDNVHYNPTEAKTWVRNVPNTTSMARTFSLAKSGSTAQKLYVVIIFPASQTSIEGTYHFPTTEEGVVINASGSYWSNATTNNVFKGGSVTVAHLGQDEYKLTFNDAVLGSAASLDAPISITGIGSGIFEEVEE